MYAVLMYTSDYCTVQCSTEQRNDTRKTAFHGQGKTLNCSRSCTELYTFLVRWRVTQNNTATQDRVHFSIFLNQWSISNISQGQTAYQRFLVYFLLSG